MKYITWFAMAKSDGILAEPATCCKSTWYRLAVDRNDVTRGLAENSPRRNLSIACTQGLLSVRTHVRWVDWTMYALKCFTAAAIHSASISHGSHVTWCFRNFALKKPARRIFSSRMTYSVAPMPHLLTEPSVTIQSWSLRPGRTMSLVSRSFDCADANCSVRISFHTILSFDWRPAMAFSSGVRVCAQLGSTRASTLYAPINDRRPWTVSGSLQVVRTDTLCGLVESLPWVQIQPRMVVERGQIIVFEAERRRPHVSRDFITLDQFARSSSGLLPPQYRSSANLAKYPACKWSPRTRHISSSRAVSEPRIAYKPLCLCMGLRDHSTSGIVLTSEFGGRHLLGLLQWDTSIGPLCARLSQCQALGTVEVSNTFLHPQKRYQSMTAISFCNEKRRIQILNR